MGAITLTGANSFLLRNALKKHVDDFVHANGEMGVERFDAEEKEASEIISNFSSTSLFATNKLVVIKGIAKNQELAEKIDELLDKANEGTELIILEPKLDKRSKLYARLKKETALSEFSEVHPGALGAWVVKEVTARGGRISSSTAKTLVDKAGSNQDLLSSEIDKLLIYSSEITDQSIELLVEANPHSKTFELVDAVFRRDLKRVERLYAEQRALKVDPNQIIGLIAWQLHLLAAVKVASGRNPMEIAKDLGVRPEAVSSSMRLANGITLAELIAMIERLLVIDHKLKQQAVDKDDALLFWLLSL